MSKLWRYNKTRLLKDTHAVKEILFSSFKTPHPYSGTVDSVCETVTKLQILATVLVYTALL